MLGEHGAAAGAELPAAPGLGVFCTNDQLAVGVIRALGGLGLEVPDDVAVV